MISGSFSCKCLEDSIKKAPYLFGTRQKYFIRLDAVSFQHTHFIIREVGLSVVKESGLYRFFVGLNIYPPFLVPFSAAVSSWESHFPTMTVQTREPLLFYGHNKYYAPGPYIPASLPLCIESGSDKI